MGMEYRLRFEDTDPEGILRTLGQLPSATSSSSGAVKLEFREAAGASSMPDATFQLAPSGAYFCDYGGHGREVLGRIIACLVSHFRQVTVEDWEP